MDEAVQVVEYGAARVTIYRRADGMAALAWREDGRQRRTTRATWEKAVAWAKGKVREMDGATGGRFVSPAAEERLRWLERVAGGAEEAGRLLLDVEEARGVLDGRGTLLEAARWYVAHGPAGARRMLLGAAVEAFLKDYEGRRENTTVKPLRVELRRLSKGREELPLMEVSPALLDEVARSGMVGDRTIRNRMAVYTTFFLRARAEGWWPKGRDLPTELLRRPPRSVSAPEVWTPEQGAAILKAVREHLPQHLSYVLIAGWLGLRPTECQRIKRADFDWENGLLHVCARTARKVRRERWVPIDKRLAAVLRPLVEAEETHHRAAKAQATRKNSRMFVSAKLRDLEVIERWPQDVWRHSFITYRLQIVKNTAQVADEAGNSEREIRASYKRPVPPGEGERWWAVLESAG